MDRWTTTGHSCPWQAGSPAQDGSSGLDSSGEGGGEGRPLQETLGPGAIALGDMSTDCPDSMQRHAVGGVGRRQAPGRAQHSPLRQGRQVAADERGVSEPGGGVEEGCFRFGGLEKEEHQGICSAVVAAGVVAGEVTSEGTQAIRDRRQRSGAAPKLPLGSGEGANLCAREARPDTYLRVSNRAILETCGNSPIRYALLARNSSKLWKACP